MRSAIIADQPNTLQSEEGLQGFQMLDINVRLLQIAGIWPSGLKRHTLFGKVCLALNIAMYIYGLSGCTAYLLLESKGISEVVERLSVWITIFKHFVKLLLFLINREKILSLIYRVEQNFLIHGTELNTEHKRAVISLKKKIRQMSLGFSALVLMTCISYIVHPFVKFYVDGSTIDGRRPVHPFKNKLFMDFKKSPFYEWEWFIDTIGCFLTGLGTAAPDTFIAAICLCLTCQFQMLGSSLRDATRNITLKLASGSTVHKGSYEPTVKDAVKNNGIFKHHLDLLEGPKDVNKQKFDSKINQYLVECIQHHQSLLQYVDDLNDALGVLFFSDFLITTLMACILEFWLVVTEDRGLEFFKAILHLMCLLTQFLFYNYLSSELSFVSEEVSTAAYESDWYLQNVNYQCNIRFIIMRAQKSVALTACSFGKYSLSTFASVMQRSYSYLAVMRSFHESLELANK